MIILIFDTYGGLCNQMYDIHHAINFCIIYNVHFSFRYSSLREKHDLTQWYNIPFNQLFDDKFIETKLYIPIEEIKLNEKNTFHLHVNERAINWLDKDRPLLPQFYKLNKQHIILRQFWSICPQLNDIINVYEIIKPSKQLQHLFDNITSSLPEIYNFLHYRYEEDFISHFKIENHPKLCFLIENVKFKEKHPIYVAAYQLNQIPEKYLSKPIDSFSNIVYKNHDTYNMNFEELAFIDFLIGKNARQVYGHSNSSFSWLLNASHNTNFYYNQ